MACGISCPGNKSALMAYPSPINGEGILQPVLTDLAARVVCPDFIWLFCRSLIATIENEIVLREIRNDSRDG